MDTQGGGEPASDAELVRASVGGDRNSFAALYDRYADGVYDFCTSVLRDRDDAADAMQDTFLIAAVRLNQLRDPTWSGHGSTPSRATNPSGEPVLGRASPRSRT